MSSQDPSHVRPHTSEDELMRYADGEMPQRDAERVRAHLEACWQCRAELDEMQRTVGDCARFRNSVLETYSPAPPAPWCDIRRRFEEADAQIGQRSFWAAAGEILLAPARRPRRWATAAVAALAVTVLIHQLWETPKVEAAVLLRKAAAAADARKASRGGAKAAAKQIGIRQAGRRLTRVIGAASPAPVAAPLDTANLEASLERLFREARYDWNDPLSASAFLDWHGRLADKRDAVSRSDSGYIIRTTSSSSSLIEATLTLREADLQPVEGTFQFRDQEKIEVREIAVELAPDIRAGPAPAPAKPVPARPAAPPEETRQAAAPASPSDEIRVIAALHTIRADLGDPIEVVRSADRILVTGIGLDAERQREIARTLEAMPRVAVRFQESGAAELQPVRPAGRRPVTSPEAARLQSRIEEYLGGRPAFERFAERLLDNGERMMAHAHALRRLGERFTPSAEAALDAAGRRTLETLREEHSAAIRRECVLIDSLIAPPLQAAGAKGQPAPTVMIPSNWQTWAALEFQSAQQVERLLTAVVAGASLDEGSGEVASQLLTALNRLRAVGDSAR
jgi:anti-sigma factor RsiW